MRTEKEIETKLESLNKDLKRIEEHERPEPEKSILAGMYCWRKALSWVLDKEQKEIQE